MKKDIYNVNNDLNRSISWGELAGSRFQHIGPDLDGSRSYSSPALALVKTTGSLGWLADDYGNILALPEFPWLARCLTRSGMSEELVAMQVECEALEKPANIEDPVAAPGEHLHAVVEAIDKPAGLPTLEVVRDLIHPPIDCPQKALELGQLTLAHPLAPRPDRAFSPGLRVVAVEQV